MWFGKKEILIYPKDIVTLWPSLCLQASRHAEEKQNSLTIIQIHDYGDDCTEDDSYFKNSKGGLPCKKVTKLWTSSIAPLAPWASTPPLSRYFCLVELVRTHVGPTMFVVQKLLGMFRRSPLAANSTSRHWNSHCSSCRDRWETLILFQRPIRAVATTAAPPQLNTSLEFKAPAKYLELHCDESLLLWDAKCLSLSLVLSVSVSFAVYVRACLCAHACVFMSTCVCACIYMCVSARICVWLCVYARLFMFMQPCPFLRIAVFCFCLCAQSHVFTCDRGEQQQQQEVT